ncbi:MAG: ABA4-like family protein [Rhizobiaceae bacterium]
MNYELAFSAASILAMIGWLVLLASPFYPKWSDRISGYLIPLILSVGYVALLALSPSHDGGGFGSLAQVMKLFSYPDALLAGWVHYLAFDLFIGAWQCRTARAEGMKFWLVIPCLALTFLVGPVGLLTFAVLRRGSLQLQTGNA